MNTVRKIDEKTLEVTKTVETVAALNIDYLYEQIAAIEAQKRAFIEARDAEIFELQELINAANDTGITSGKFQLDAKGSPVAIGQETMQLL